MIKISSLSKEAKERYNKLVAKSMASGNDKGIAIKEATDILKSEGLIKEKKYINYRKLIEEDAIDINQDGVIDSEDIILALDLLETKTELERDFIDFLLVAAEEDLIHGDMLEGIFEIVGDHADLSDVELDDAEKLEEAKEAETSCSIEEVRALALIRKGKQKRKTRCKSGPAAGKIRTVGNCGKKVNRALSKKLSRVKQRNKSKLKRSAKKAARTAKRRGTR